MMWKWMTRFLMAALVATLGFGSGQAEASTKAKTAVQKVQKQTTTATTPDLQLPSEQDAFRGLVHPIIAIVLNFVPLPGFGIGSFIQGDFMGGLTIIGTGILGWALIGLGVGMSQGVTVSLGLVSVLAGTAVLIFSLVWSVVAPMNFGYRGGRFRRFRRRRWRRRRYRRPYYKDYKLNQDDKANPFPLGQPQLAVEF